MVLCDHGNRVVNRVGMRPFSPEKRNTTIGQQWNNTPLVETMESRARKILEQHPMWDEQQCAKNGGGKQSKGNGDSVLEQRTRHLSTAKKIKKPASW